VVTLFAVMSAGRVPAMINFTAGAANILAACRAAEVDTILTSRAFVEKGRLDNLVAQLETKLRMVYLEDIRPTIGLADKLRGLLHWLEEAAGRAQARRLGGDPVHLRLGRNCRRASCCHTATCWPTWRRPRRRIDFGREDKLFNVLPVFHSFGLTAGTVLPLVCGVPVYLYPSPLHYRTVPELVYGTCATICSAPTRSSTAMRASPILMTSARCATCLPAPSR
jgi:acyl-[acyl-carrier-protein]-phospholipid O-acyltransferase/long-chain-fatty-acid--[acyl-carrier-protein] ligase